MIYQARDRLFLDKVNVLVFIRLKTEYWRLSHSFWSTWHCKMMFSLFFSMIFSYILYYAFSCDPLAFFYYQVFLKDQPNNYNFILSASTQATASTAMRLASSRVAGHMDLWAYVARTPTPATMASSTRWTTRRTRMASRLRALTCPHLPRCPTSKWCALNL